MSHTPVRSIIGLACPLVGTAVFAFLTTSQGQAFNERVFGHLYTLGAILMLGGYGAFFLALFAVGVVCSVTAWMRNEQPAWLPRLAIGLNVLPPVAVLLYRSYF